MPKVVLLVNLAAALPCPDLTRTGLRRCTALTCRMNEFNAPRLNSAERQPALVFQNVSSIGIDCWMEGAVFKCPSEKLLSYTTYIHEFR